MPEPAFFLLVPPLLLLLLLWLQLQDTWYMLHTYMLVGT
jgi:hypothetical protein